MPVEAPPDPPPPPPRGHTLPRNVYPLRVLGLACGFLAVQAAFREIGAHPLAWIALVFHAFAWPHLAFLAARRSADPWRAERRNLVADSAAGGAWIALMGFNVLPSVLIASMLSLDKITVGGPRLLAQAAAAMVASLAATAFLAGPGPHPETSFDVVLACLPLLVLYPLSIGFSTYGLRLRIRGQKQRLDHLLRTERLSGLATRQHWVEVLAAEFERCGREGRFAAVVIFDIDDFKKINDTHGHPVGDDLIRRLGEILLSELRATDVACRYGGDEFGVLLPDATMAEACAISERMRRAIERLRLAGAPAVRCTATFGVALMGPETAGTLDAIVRADRALYRGKAAGRNRVATEREEPIALRPA
jgi:diguanylate cyclase